MSPISPFGWKENKAPWLSPVELEKDRQQIAEYAEAQAMAARIAAEAASDPLGSATTAEGKAITAATAKANTAQANAEATGAGNVVGERERAEAAEALRAPLASPALTGTPTAPTPAEGDNSMKVSTTAYADRAADEAREDAETASDKAGEAKAEKERAEAAEALKAPLASPTLTGTPVAPTATPGTKTTQIATTAFVGKAASEATGGIALGAALNYQGTVEGKHGTSYVPLFQQFWKLLVCENECKIEKTFSNNSKPLESERRTKPSGPDLHLMAEMLTAIGTTTPLHLHTFIWHVNNPEWLTNPLVAWTEETLRAAAKVYIQSTLTEALTKARIVSIDVINEVLTSATNKLRETFWTEHFGGSLEIVKTNPAVRFYAECFKWCWEITPTLPLYYNDASLELDSQYEAGKAGKEKGLAALQFVEVLKEVFTEIGVPTTVLNVGFECHRETGAAGVNYPSTAELARHMREFQALGCKTRISELDVKIKEGGTFAQQSEALAAMVQAAELTGSGLATWGMTNASTFQGGATALNAEVTLPAATMEIESATGFNAEGEVVVNPFSTKPQSVKYAKITGKKLEGCTGGTGIFTAGVAVLAKPPNGPRPLFWSGDLIPEPFPSWGVLAASRSGSGPEASSIPLLPLASPVLTGTPKAPTAAAKTNTEQVATTAFVTGAVAENPGGVSKAEAEAIATASTKTEKERAETAEALRAPLASPVLTGTPKAPTAAAKTNTEQLATTAFAQTTKTEAEAASDPAGTSAAGVNVEKERAEAAEALKAPLASPMLTGTPKAPSAAAKTNTEQLATTAFAQTTKTEAEEATKAEVKTEKERAEAAEALKAPRASPVLTGTPKGPTATAKTNTEQLATTAFVQTAKIEAVGEGRAGILPVWMPIAAKGSPEPILNGAIGEGNLAVFMRMNPIYKAGTLKELAVWSATHNGTTRLAIFDCGATTAKQYTVLWEGAEVEAGTGAWLIQKPELAVTAGQELLAAVMNSGATQTYGQSQATVAINVAGTQLPPNFLPVAGESLPKIIGKHKYGATSFGAAGAKLTEAELEQSTSPVYTIIGRVE